MTTEEIRNARKSFAEQLTNMIRDFERQTGKTIQGINVERENFKRREAGVRDNGGIAQPLPALSLFKGVYLAIE